MSAELDPFFAALRHDADGLPVAAPADVRRLGVRRRHRTTLIAAVTAFVVVGVVAVVIGAGLPHGRPRPTDPATSTPTATEAPPKFNSLVPVGAGIRYGNGKPNPGADAPRSGSVVTVGDRAFVCWQHLGGKTSVVAVDLMTGRTVWGPVQVGTFHDVALVLWHPRYVLVMGAQDDTTAPGAAIITLDPATGKTLLHIDVFDSDGLLFGESTVAIASQRDGTTRGYDLATGRVQWTVPDPPSRIVHSEPMLRAAGQPVASQRSEAGRSPVIADRFVQYTADGTAIVRDMATGAESARRTGAISSAGVAADGNIDSALAVDGILYTINPGDEGTIRAMNLTRPAAVSSMYTAGSGTKISFLIWCGPARICFSEQGPGTGRLVEFDTEHRKVLWRHDGPVLRPQALDGQILMNFGDAPGVGGTVIYDATGRQVLKDGSRSAGWIDGRSALLFGGKSFEPGAEVFGVAPLDGDPVPLGTIGENVGCGWSRTHLACVTLTGIKVWRFAT